MYKFIMHYLLVCMNEQIHVYTHALHPVALISAWHAPEFWFEFLTEATHQNPLNLGAQFTRNWSSNRTCDGNG